MLTGAICFQCRFSELRTGVQPLFPLINKNQQEKTFFKSNRLDTDRQSHVDLHWNLRVNLVNTPASLRELREIFREI